MLFQFRMASFLKADCIFCIYLNNVYVKVMKFKLFYKPWLSLFTLTTLCLKARRKTDFQSEVTHLLHLSKRNKWFRLLLLILFICKFFLLELAHLHFCVKPRKLRIKLCNVGPTSSYRRSGIHHWNKSFPVKNKRLLSTNCLCIFV